MGDSNPDSLNDTTRRSRAKHPVSSATVPCLTILCHPDPRRLGEQVLLAGLLVGKAVSVSRLGPAFAQPDGATAARPLEDSHVSRTPLQITSARSGATFTLTGPRGEATVDGQPLDGSETVVRERLARGVVILLGGHVLLLLHQTCSPGYHPIEGIVGHSDAIALVRQEIAAVAASDIPVLVRGETGTGKELVARAVHEQSRRARHEYVAVNMATLASSVAVSTLFGHGKGAFTGAQQRHAGLFERASGGTLFLDEIGATPLVVQPMLLRAIESGTILPLGEEVARPVDVRLVAATDADLEHDVEDGTFRAALLHRLAGYEIRVPPLRERRDDIPRLFVALLEAETARTAGEAAGGDRPRVPVDLMIRLVGHPLPGNVRQLRNVVRQIALASAGLAELVTTAGVERLLDGGLEPPAARPAAASSPPPGRGSSVSDEALLAALEESDWSPARAATRLGLATSTLHDLMQRRGIRRASDLSDEDLLAAHRSLNGDVGAMASRLRVSPRALLLALKSRRIV